MKSYLRRVLSRRQKVVCVGLGKTGTTTLDAAMEILTYRRCPGSQDLNFAFHQGYEWPLRIPLARYDHFSDFPWPYLYEAVNKLYPNSRFILTRRKCPEVWLDSLMRHYSRGGPTDDKWIFHGYYSPFQNPNHHLRLYEAHNQRVREFFKGRPNFLEVCWEEGDGWEQLCGFLGRSIPEAPFPHSNAAPKTIDYDEARIEADKQLSHFLR